MVDLVMRVVNLGVTGDQPPAEVRRIQTINLIVLFAIFYNVLYTTLYVLLDFSGLLPVIIANTVSILLYGTAAAANSQQKTRAAMWLLLGTALVNMTLAHLVLGSGTGIFLFMAVLPVTGVLISPPNDRTTPLLIIIASMIAFVVAVLGDPSTPDPIAGTAIETVLLVTSVISTVLMLGVVGFYFKRVADTAEAELLVANERSERLLLNILPEEIADRLKAADTTIADYYESASVLFADIVDFTPMSAGMSASEVVGLLNNVFTTFDGFVDELGLEKIKTVGDEYMVASGVPGARHDHADAIAGLALRIRDHVAANQFDGHEISLRIGINSGPVVAGIIGTHKFAYDLWGDAVNTASRMESAGVAGSIQVTQATYELIRDKFVCEPRGVISVKGKGDMDTYFLISRRADAPAAGLDALS